MLAKAIEKSDVHRRIALGMVNVIGGNSGRRMVFAFMVTAAALSMWISNTATVLALLPVALAITETSKNKHFNIALLLGLAYAASLGGAGTLIGTPPNLIFASVYNEMAGEEYSFLTWMKVSIPIIILAIPVMAMWLTRKVKLTNPIQLPKVGQWQKAEVRTLLVFSFVALLWVTRKEPFGGWSSLLDMPMIGDSSIALFGVVLMFLVSDGKGGRLLDWETAVNIPWGMLLLFAGGICLAKGIFASGLSQLIGESLTSLTTFPILILLLGLTLSVSFLTEVSSNTATATLLMPILASLAISQNMPLEILMLPAVISCSCAFCLPVATAPNSIVFSSDQVTIQQMVREGVVLNIIVAVIVSLVCYAMLV